MPTFLARYTAAQIVHAAILLLIVGALVIQTVRIEGFRLWPISIKGLRAELSETKRTIKGLQSKSREKQVEVREVIRQGKDRIVVVEKEVGRIEGAPLPGNCRTPDAVMGADV